MGLAEDKEYSCPPPFFFATFLLKDGDILSSWISYVGKDNDFMSRMCILLNLQKAAPNATHFC